jgi:hypothetical protein
VARDSRSELNKNLVYNTTSRLLPIPKLTHPTLPLALPPLPPPSKTHLDIPLLVEARSNLVHTQRIRVVPAGQAQVAQVHVGLRQPYKALGAADGMDDLIEGLLGCC